MAKNPAEFDEMLGRKDPYEFWLQEAGIHAGPLSYISAIEVLAIVQNAFGKDWLDEKIKEPEKGSFLDSSRHPLAKLILVPGKTQVMSVLELGIYLKQLSQVPRLDEVIRQLKNKDDFENTLIQLAYGFRFSKIGASDVAFEPDVDNGRKADIIFKFCGQSYIAECFLPERGEFWYGEFGQLSQNRIFDYTRHVNKKICFSAMIRNEPPFDYKVRKEFEADWRQLIGDLENSKPQKISKNNYEIDIQEISHLNHGQKEALFKSCFEEKHCRFVYAESAMPKAEALDTMRGVASEREKNSMLFFKVEEEETPQEEMVNDLAKKMEKKVAQLRLKNTDTKGILIVASPVVHPRNMQSTKPFERLQGKVVEAHDYVEAATIVHKTTGPGGDPRFGGYILQSKRTGMKVDLLNALEAFESKGALLE